MRDRVLADIVVIVHYAFIAFVVAGGLLVFWRRWIAWLHLPAVAWGAWTEFTSTICPLTPWEQALLRRAGEAGYGGGFIEHYLIPTIYPAGLTPGLQLLLGIGVLVINLVIYATVWWHRRANSLHDA